MVPATNTCGSERGNIDNAGSKSSGADDGGTQLIVLRGNAGSGKSSTARALRHRVATPLAWVEQDYFRRVLLAERDRPEAAVIGLLEQTVRFCLSENFSVILDGVLGAYRFEPMLARLQRDLAGRAHFFYFDVDFAETVRRHQLRSDTARFGAGQMRGWYREHDRLTGIREVVIPAASSLHETVELVLARSGLGPS